MSLPVISRPSELGAFMCLGSDTASPVTPDYTLETSRFTGEIEWVQIDVDAASEDVDHLIAPEKRLQLAMGRH